MQTFLPYRCFTLSAQVLDNKRLGKQRIEGVQILNCLLGKTNGWQYHPAVQMWRGHENALREYINAVVKEWRSRGFKNNITRFIIRSKIIYPAWLGEPRFHQSHRSNLLRKDPDHYGQYGWNESSDLPYFWPYNRRNKKWIENVCYRVLAKELIESMNGGVNGNS